MSNVYVHFSQISFSTRYSVVNFQLEPHSLSFRKVIFHRLFNTALSIISPIYELLLSVIPHQLA